MSWDAASNTMLTAFNASNPISNVAWDAFNGGTYKPPAVNTTSPGSAVWVRPQIVEKTTVPFAFGSSNYAKHDGDFVIALFSPLGFGEDIFASYVATLVAIFEYQTFSGGISCGPTHVERLGPDPEGEPWFQINIVTPFWRVATD